MTSSSFSCEVTNTHARPEHFVNNCSVMVCRFSIRWVLRPMNWPTSSMKKPIRAPGSRESSQWATSSAKASAERFNDAR